MTYLLPETLGNEILAYLVQQPYAEVARLVAGLMQIVKVPEPEAAPAPVPV